MRIRPLPKSIQLRAMGGAFAFALLGTFASEAQAQRWVFLPAAPVPYFAASAVPVQAATAPAPAVAPAAPVYYQAPAVAPAVAPSAVYSVPAQAVTRQRSAPRSMSGSSFSTRWRADLKASGRGHRP